MKKMLSIAAVAALATSSFAASDLAGAFKEGKASGQIRAMYVYNDFKNDDHGGPDTKGIALGGKLGFETAPVYGISAGAVLYTSQDMGLKNPASTGRQDPYTYDENGNSYSLLGQAYLQGQFGKTTVKVGRQQLDTPLAGSDDIRMIPNLFEAALVINTNVPDTTLIGGYVARMAGLDSVSDKSARTQFQSMSRAALGALVDNTDTTAQGGHAVTAIQDKGVAVAAIINNSVKDLTLQVWDYYAYDVLNAIYAQADYKLGLGKDMALNLSAQYEHLNDMGKTKDVLRSIDAKVGYDVYGVKASLETPIGLTPYLAYNKVSEQKNGTGLYVFGAWGGYAEFAMGEETWYNSLGTGVLGTATQTSMNGAAVYKIGADYSLEKVGLGARTIGLAYTKFDLKDKYNQTGTPAVDTDKDMNVWDLKYTCSGALVKNLDATVLFESADSKYNALDRKTAKVVFNYNF